MTAQPTSQWVGVDYATEPDIYVQAIRHPDGRFEVTHRVTRQSDEYACSCGARWDANDGSKHS